eukprot:5322716-Alexandrium_andersonii.AAC.1
MHLGPFEGSEPAPLSASSFRTRALAQLPAVVGAVGRSPALSGEARRCLDLPQKWQTMPKGCQRVTGAAER